MFPFKPLEFPRLKLKPHDVFTHGGMKKTVYIVYNGEHNGVRMALADVS